MANYINIIGEFFPNTEAELAPNGNPTNYGDIVWISTPISQSVLDSYVTLIDTTTTTEVVANISNSITNGDTIIWNGSSFSSGTLKLSTNLSDVNITENAGIDGYGLVYNHSTTKWIASQLAPILKLYKENPSSPTIPSALGINSVAIGNGSQTDTNAPESLAIGNQSLARIRGGVVQASGRFGSQGDAQTGRYLLRTHTVNNSPTEMFIDGTAGSIRLTIPDNSTWTFAATITAHRTDINDGHAGYKVEGVIFRNSGVSSTNIQGRIIKNVFAESNSSWDINITADQVNGSLKITVTGENSKTVRWLALVETVEITN